MEIIQKANTQSKMNFARAIHSMTLLGRTQALRLYQQDRKLSAKSPTTSDDMKTNQKKENEKKTVGTSASTQSDLRHKEGLKGTIAVEGPADVSQVSGVPEQHIQTRL